VGAHEQQQAADGLEERGEQKEAMQRRSGGGKAEDLRKPADSFWQESGRLAEIETDILYDTGAVINALPLKAGRDREPSAFMEELTRDGRDL
jgi:hypothetical protein